MVEPPVFYRGRSKADRYRRLRRCRVDVRDHLGLARMVSLQFGVPPGDVVDDSWQYADCLYALTKAAKDFDPKRGFQFSTFAVCYMQHYLNTRLKSMYWEKRLGGRRDASTNTPVPGDYGDTIEMGETIVRPEREEMWEAADRREQVAKLLGRLHQRHRRFVTLYYLDGLTMAEIGEREGVCKERVRQILEEALRTLRRLEGTDPASRPASARRPAKRSASAVA